MNPFVRFILIILIAGSAVNLTVVLLANARSSRSQLAQIRHDRDQLASMFSNIGGHLRRADIVFESQRVDAHGKAIDTTLLVRQYASVGSDQSQPLKIARLVIPGDRLVVHGMLLEASGTFAEDAGDYQVLRGTQLAYFGTFCGENEKPPASPQTPDPRFTYMPRYAVPQLTRLKPFDERPSFYEVRLWQYLWDLIPDPIPPASVARRGLTVRALATKPTTVLRERTYTAYISPNGMSLEENSVPTIPGLLEVMIKEGEKLEDVP